MSDTTAPVASATPVQIKFVVGEARVELAQLLSLTEGQVIDGEALFTYFPQVRAVLGERQIAQGELVKIDGKVGFRINKLL